MVNVIFPHGALGPSPNDSLLDTALRQIGMAASTDTDEWSEKYGADYENETFMMHRYCWCDRTDCPWCGGCDCPGSSFHYYVDHAEVAYEEWVDCYRRLTSGLRYGSRAYETASAEAKRRRAERHDAVCDYCLGKGVFAGNGAELGKGAPNFWYKPTNLKVWWYKYIGRGMETNRELTAMEIDQMQQHCSASLAAKEQENT